MSQPLVYFNTASLDGYIAGPDGRWDWGVPDHEVHSFVNELFAPVTTYLYGRRVYEVMEVWETFDLDELSDAERAWALDWRASDKVVYSRTLTEVRTGRTELRSSFDADEVARWKQAADAPIGIGGGNLASEAARAGLLDEVHVVIATAVVGGGTRLFDEGLDLRLELRGEKRFANGFVYLAYSVVR